MELAAVPLSVDNDYAAHGESSGDEHDGEPLVPSLAAP